MAKSRKRSRGASNATGATGNAQENIPPSKKKRDSSAAKVKDNGKTVYRDTSTEDLATKPEKSVSDQSSCEVQKPLSEKMIPTFGKKKSKKTDQKPAPEKEIEQSETNNDKPQSLSTALPVPDDQEKVSNVSSGTSTVIGVNTSPTETNSKATANQISCGTNDDAKHDTVTGSEKVEEIKCTTKTPTNASDNTSQERHETLENKENKTNNKVEDEVQNEEKSPQEQHVDEQLHTTDETPNVMEHQNQETSENCDKTTVIGSPKSLLALAKELLNKSISEETDLSNINPTDIFKKYKTNNQDSSIGDREIKDTDINNTDNKSSPPKCQENLVGPTSSKENENVEQKNIDKCKNEKEDSTKEVMEVAETDASVPSDAAKPDYEESSQEISDSQLGRLDEQAFTEPQPAQSGMTGIQPENAAPVPQGPPPVTSNTKTAPNPNREATPRPSSFASTSYLQPDLEATRKVNAMISQLSNVNKILSKAKRDLESVRFHHQKSQQKLHMMPHRNPHFPN